MKGETSDNPIDTVSVVKMWMNGYTSALVFPIMGTVTVDEDLTDFYIQVWVLGRTIGLDNMARRDN